MTNTYTTLRGNVITTNEAGTHCYTWPEGRKGERVRIKKAEYEQIIREDELERKMAAEQEDAEVEAAVEATEESQTTEETQLIAKEFAPKKKRIRKSKDTAYDGNGITLTAKQVDFIKHLPDTCFWENGLDSCIWIDCLCDEIGGQFENKPMTVGAIISTLCEKGLGSRGSEKRNGRKCTSFELTELGKKVAVGLGL
jgi:hypothetical protein